MLDQGFEGTIVEVEGIEDLPLPLVYHKHIHSICFQRLSMHCYPIELELDLRKELERQFLP